MEQAEQEWGAWGTVYYEDDGRLLGLMQCGPSALFPRALELPAGPSSADALLVACVYLVDPSSPWIVQSLFLSAIGEARSRNVKALEAFAYRYGEDESLETRVIAHRAIFPHDLLADLGFFSLRSAGRVQLARLELGGLEPAGAPLRERAARRLKRVRWPTPAAAPPHG
jgi:hypothetical protein